MHGLIETVPKGGYAGAVVTVTQKGVAYLSDARQAKVAAQQSHHALGKRLALHLRSAGFYTWENIEIANPSQDLNRRNWGVVRPDVYACLPALKARNSAPAIYEVKSRRADFLADVNKPEKCAAYADLAEAVYYCCPDGLVGKDEVPADCGLLCEMAPGTFELKKRARRRKGFVLAVDVAMTLMVKRQVPLAIDEPAQADA